MPPPRKDDPRPIEFESARGRRAFEALVEAIVAAPEDIPEHEIDRYVRGIRSGHGLPRTGRDSRRPKARADISERELEAVRLMADGLKTKEIAHVMGVSPYTINTYLDRLRSRFVARNGPHLIAILFRRGLLR